VANTAFIWGQSHWGQPDATWDTPGVVYLGAAIVSQSSVANLAIGLSFSGGPPPAPTGSATYQLGAVITSYSFLGVGDSDSAYVEADNSGVYVSATTNRVYMRMPARYRNDDAIPEQQQAVLFEQPTTFDTPDDYDTNDDYDYTAAVNAAQAAAGTRPFLRFMSTILDQAGDIETLINRFGYDQTQTPPKLSALTDPAQADADWLPWLGMFVGLNITSPVSLTAVAGVRSLLAGANTAAPRGSKTAIAAAVSTLFNITVLPSQVTDHYGGNVYQIGVQMPSVQNLSVTELASVKPAGYSLVSHT
jgi:hypothetical protein